MFSAPNLSSRGLCSCFKRFAVRRFLIQMNATAIDMSRTTTPAIAIPMIAPWLRPSLSFLSGVDDAEVILT